MEANEADLTAICDARLLDRVRERDLDLMMAEEFYCSEKFRQFILERCGKPPSHTLVRVKVSEVTDAGESDVLLVVEANSSEQVAIMIEHKIDAIFQPAQPERYVERGNGGQRKGLWDEYRTVLCGPSSYVDPLKEFGKWNTYLSLEEIAAFWRNRNDMRGKFLATVYEQAIKKHNDHAKEISPLATAFWIHYRERVRKLLPTVTIGGLPDLVSEASPWPRFTSPSLSAGPNLEHKPQQGWVDLTFPGMPREKLRQALPVLWPSDVACVAAGHSAALRIKVDRISHLLPFDEQSVKVDSALRAVQRLLDLSGSIPDAMLALRKPEDNTQSADIT